MIQSGLQEQPGDTSVQYFSERFRLSWRDVASAFKRERENGWRLPDVGGSEKDKNPLWSTHAVDGADTAVSHTEVVQGSLSRRFEEQGLFVGEMCTYQCAILKEAYPVSLFLFLQNLQQP